MEEQVAVDRVWDLNIASAGKDCLMEMHTSHHPLGVEVMDTVLVEKEGEYLNYLSQMFCR